MTEQRRSYAGECVYVGVDVHKETDVAILYRTHGDKSNRYP